jgi:hypothetical protein
MKTIRQRMITLLEEEPLTARDLSKRVGIREREVFEHLSHIARTVMAQGKTLAVQPYRCLGCGYTFEDRKRYTRPSRCPRCKNSQLDSARYRII